MAGGAAIAASPGPLSGTLAGGFRLLKNSLRLPQRRDTAPSAQLFRLTEFFHIVKRENARAGQECVTRGHAGQKGFFHFLYFHRTLSSPPHVITFGALWIRSLISKVANGQYFYFFGTDFSQVRKISLIEC